VFTNPRVDVVLDPLRIRHTFDEEAAHRRLIDDITTLTFAAIFLGGMRASEADPS